MRGDTGKAQHQTRARKSARGTGKQAEAPDAGRAVWKLLWQLVLGERANLHAAWAEFEVTPAQAHLLHQLEPDRLIPMNELAGALGCDASNVTGLVDKLEARGLIARQTVKDRRVKMIALTSAGVSLRSRLLARLFQPPAFMASLSEPEKQVLRDILEKALRHARAQPRPDR